MSEKKTYENLQLIDVTKKILTVLPDGYDMTAHFRKNTITIRPRNNYEHLEAARAARKKN